MISHSQHEEGKPGVIFKLVHNWEGKGVLQPSQFPQRPHLCQLLTPQLLTPQLLHRGGGPGGPREGHPRGSEHSYLPANGKILHYFTATAILIYAGEIST